MLSEFQPFNLTIFKLMFTLIFVRYDRKYNIHYKFVYINIMSSKFLESRPVFTDRSIS